MAHNFLVYQQFFSPLYSLSHAHFQFSASLQLSIEKALAQQLHKIYKVFNSPFLTASAVDEANDFWKELEGSSESEEGKD